MFTISYFSCYNEPYSETKLCFSREEADEIFQNYIKDIYETEGALEEYDEEEYKGDMSFDFAAQNGHIYQVEIEEHDDAPDDDCAIAIFINMLKKTKPNRFDAADEEHLVDSIKKVLEYIDDTNERED